MPTVTVDLGPLSYPIEIGAGILEGIGELVVRRLGKRKALVVTNSTLQGLYGRAVVDSLNGAGMRAEMVAVPDSEEAKSLPEASRLYDAAVSHGLDRKSVIVALGGGVVGDLAGFVAATYMRGIPFVQVPTTLLAQVDASVGGKVAVNHPRGKNLIGAFHQPKLVAIDSEVLLTLPERDLRAGMAEVIKHGVIAGEAYFRFLEEKREAIGRLEAGVMESLIEKSCRIKARVVEHDEKESGLRAVLNFGHTAGHALEAATGFQRFHHGEAVPIGMVAASRLAEDLGMASGVSSRIERILEAFGLETRIPGLGLDEIMEAMALDKKAEGGRLKWVLPRAVGQVEITSIVPEDAVRRALVGLGALA